MVRKPFTLGEEVLPTKVGPRIFRYVLSSFLDISSMLMSVTWVFGCRRYLSLFPFESINWLANSIVLLRVVKVVVATTKLTVCWWQWVSLWVSWREERF